MRRITTPWLVVLACACLSSCAEDAVAPVADVIQDTQPLLSDTEPAHRADTVMPADSGLGEGDVQTSMKPAAVTRAASYEVETIEDVVFAQGLVHTSWDWANPKSQDLTLDVYLPKDGAKVGKPAIVLIHGGGFKQGHSKQGTFRNMAEYFASRGWVAVSINYRLTSDFGLAPESWLALTPATGLTQDQHNATYSGARDAKAALRWLHANAETYGIHPDYVTVGGGSAGAMLSVALGVSNPKDFRDELTVDQDPTLASTHPGASAKVATILDFWGSDWLLDSLTVHDGVDRFDPSDASLVIFHGLHDEAVVYAGAEELAAKYTATGVSFAHYPLDAGHSAWQAKVDGQSLVKLAFDFMVKEQGLDVLE
jgi:para-nitrobenzyl esterase